MAILDDLANGFKTIFGDNSSGGIGEFRSSAQIQEALSLQGLANIRNRAQRIIDENQPIGSVKDFENLQRPILTETFITPFNQQIAQAQNIYDNAGFRQVGPLDRSSYRYLYQGGSFSSLHPISKQNVLNIQFNERLTQALEPLKSLIVNLTRTKQRNQQGIDEIFNIVAPNSI